MPLHPPTIRHRTNRLSNAEPEIDWEQVRASFSWAALRRELWGCETGSGNIATLAVDRHALGDRRDRIALRCVGGERAPSAITFGELARRTNRFANVLVGLNAAPGTRVFVLLGRRAELFEAVLGALKAQCVVSVLFAAFGPEPLRVRLQLGRAAMLVTTEALYRHRIASMRHELPHLRQVLLLDTQAGGALPDGTQRYDDLLAKASDEYVVAATAGETPALLHFTSGTTGTPKGALHVHDAALMHFLTGRFALDLRADDTYWCTADPGWVTGV
ncbi:MAG: AMP-binding protein, partial [Steroidobacteraceae bacterium]|nr:AMP-binding protein [Steroidobacteraceae bacterium]MDW8259721.1 AMP-binding protein [Gammaproteobacteria bacterium]